MPLENRQSILRIISIHQAMWTHQNADLELNLQGREDFNMLESFSYKLGKWNLMDGPRAAKKSSSVKNDLNSG